MLQAVQNLTQTLLKYRNATQNSTQNSDLINSGQSIKEKNAETWA